MAAGRRARWQLDELGLAVARLALGIGPAGLSNGMVCAVPAVHP
jgi:hypothetical protein